LAILCVRGIFLLTLFTNLLFAFVPTMEIDTNFLQSSSKQYMLYKVDPLDSMTPMQILESNDMRELISGNFGITNIPIWTKLVIKNKSDGFINIVARNPKASIDKMDVFIYKNSTLISSYMLGDLRSQNNRPLKGRMSSFYIPLDSNESVTIVTRIHTKGVAEVGYDIFSIQRISQIAAKEMLWIGFFIGAISGLIVYNLVMFFAIKQKVFLIYVLYAFFALIYQMCYTGFIYAMDTGLNLWFIDRLSFVSPALATSFMVILPIYFFDIHKESKITKSLYLIFTILLIIGALFFLPINDMYFTVLNYVLMLCFTVSIIFLSWIGLDMMIKKRLGAFYYYIGQSSIFIAGIFIIVIAMGLIEFDKVGEYITQIAILVDAIFLSIGLSRRISNIEKQREHGERLLMMQSRFASLGQVVGNIAHQYKVPISHLGSLLMQLEANLKNNKQNPIEEAQEIVSMMKNAIRFMSNTIEEFRDFYKTEKAPELFSPVDKVKKITDLLSAKITSVMMDVDIVASSDIKIFNYKHSFAHVVMILIDNAIEATKRNRELEEPKIELTVDYVDDTIVFSIQDNCGGIRATPIESVFDKDISKNILESGAGLLIAKMLIEERMQGKISVENLNGGAKFTVRIKNIPRISV